MSPGSHFCCFHVVSVKRSTASKALPTHEKNRVPPVVETSNQAAVSSLK